jgi:hypothetical protein
MTKKSGDSERKPRETREDRQARALRVNLARRKVQARARAAQAAETIGPADAGTAPAKKPNA